MVNKFWFYIFNNELAIAHRNAYEKSLKSSHAVKAQVGTYYYRGYEIGKNGYRGCEWSYGLPDTGWHGEYGKEWAETKRQAMAEVDFILNG